MLKRKTYIIRTIIPRSNEQFLLQQKIQKFKMISGRLESNLRFKITCLEYADRKILII